MATCNFSPPQNANNYYVVLHDNIEDQIDYDFARQFLEENLIYELKKIGHILYDYDLKDYSRNYSSYSFGCFSIEKNFAEANIILEFIPIMTNAYYQGATLDYIVKVISDYEEFNPNDYNSWDSLRDAIFDPDYYDMNAGLCKIFGNKAIDWIRENCYNIGNKLDSIFENVSEATLKRMAVFSNGEAFYQEVK